MATKRGSDEWSLVGWCGSSLTATIAPRRLGFTFPGNGELGAVSAC